MADGIGGGPYALFPKPLLRCIISPDIGYILYRTEYAGR